MDILKILTRGIKDPARRPGQAAAPSINLPSAGNKANPQLFHDEVPSRKGKKRKRNRDGQQLDGAEEDDLSDVDYFATKKDAGNEDEATAAAGDEATEAAPKRKKAKLLPEDECRQILRSHRLKFTLLSGRAEEVAASEAGKKSKKDEGDSTSKKDAKDNHKKEFYPQPLNSFTELQDLYDVSPKLVENIAKQAFKLPTEVQMGSLPLLLKPKKALKHASETDMVNIKHGVDFVAVAPTGSGKTVTFMIPAIMSVIRSLEAQDCPPEEKEHKLQAIVVAPTHELAKQIVNEGRKLAMGTGVRIYSMQRGLQLGAEDVAGEDHESSSSDEDDNEESEHKGEGVQDEEGESSASDSDAEGTTKKTKGKPRRAIKPDILVTTPKSLLNALTSGTTKRALPSVTSLILDEADVLLDPLFRKQTLAIWKSCTSPSLRLTFWSATMASNIESLILKHTSRGRPSAPPPLVRLVVGLKDTAVPNITHKLIYTATEPGKLLALRQLLHPSSSSTTTSPAEPPLRPPFLIFTQTIPRATALHQELKYDIPATAGGSSRIAVLHSSLTPQARSAVMTRFRQGEVWILITTDVLARGVDFAGVNGVVSYDVPSSAAAYVHRAGRTGRAGREGGVAVTFYTKEDIPFVRSVANVIAASERQGGKVEGDATTVKKWLLDALPKVKKEDKRRLKVRGVEERRTDAKGKKGQEIGSKSSYDRRRENNRRGAIEGSKRRKKLEQMEAREGGGEKEDTGEWGGIDE
ncbi:P-loop containing nucleoside triphosphate hydrolase protein [Coniochaeta sp. 2T2.1]|nr:P-loop containing nucleoside triphosphate hydrolase protein [Coniochaeta sp. 2T2.1]